MTKQNKHKANKKLVKKFYDIEIPVKKRKYTKGGQYGKVLGFNFYIQKNEKITKKQREILLTEGHAYVNEIIGKLCPFGSSIDDIVKDIPGSMDPAFSDLELINFWNYMYDKYGYYIYDFAQQWLWEQQPSMSEYKKYLSESKNERDSECDYDFDLEYDPDSETFIEDENFEKLKESVRLKFQQYHREKMLNNQMG